ncbi:MAG TPA: FAD-dependent oxidoreductase [Acidisoma sp.]|uniref:NAD(P)/FAD-dependent oxidoreductase n=1 Tax=Acidisoma sp. TaxID=1872115 RepID=UPI002BFCD60A|nr:FAD-dependent oxidoreductase [Acidisoma sp.]HTI02124.1 FAD-dependent oxidoreductase [Acidisoma sp.]
MNCTVADAVRLTKDLPAAPLDVAIIGAGIVALATAQKLAAAGRRVALIERGGVARATSAGNAGALAFSDILPLASSGKIRQVPKWLLDPLGPLAIPPAYALKIAPWLIRFWRAGWRDRLAASLAAQVSLMRVAEAEMDRMVAEAKLSALVNHDGSLELYESAREFQESLAGWKARSDAGIAFEHVQGARMAALQPGLSRRFVSGTFVPGWRTVSDPFLFASVLARHLENRGVTFLAGEATRLKPADASVTIHLRDGQRLSAAQVVLATGAWSRRLTDPLGDRIPLETERGYNTTLPPGAFDLRRQIIFGGHGFVVTPLVTGLRVGGAVELGGLDLPPNFKRSAAMLRKAQDFLPGLKPEGGQEWMGFRPSLPDSLPVIGPSKISPRIVYAFGHGHLGLTQSAGTGQLVAELLSGTPPAIDLSPFSPRRFD